MHLYPSCRHKRDDDDIPAGWNRRESKKYPGHVFYYNRASGAKSWAKPEVIPEISFRADESEDEDDGEEPPMEEGDDRDDDGIMLAGSLPVTPFVVVRKISRDDDETKV